MHWTILVILTALAAVFLILETRGVRTTLQLSFRRGDIKRESAFLAQYGQSVATPLAAWLVAIAFGQDQVRSELRWFGLICGPVVITSISCMILKRLFGRMRPNRENEGAFTGFSWKNQNARESFPSSHSACAFALSLTLIHVWPQAAAVFWFLAIMTAILRYLMDAHFPSDILAGAVIGLLVGHFGFLWLDQTLPR